MICYTFAEKHLGEPRIRGSHHIFKMPWQDDPRINIQKDGNIAKFYQVKAVLKAIQKIEKDSEKTEEKDNVHIARCLEFPSLMAHGETSSKALSEIENVVKESIEWMINENEIIPEPFGLTQFKGNLTLRVPKEIHRNLVIKAIEAGVSINQHILSKIS